MTVKSEVLDPPKKKILPPLIANVCSPNCEECAGMWINKVIGHKIVCDCVKCSHNHKVRKKMSDDSIVVRQDRQTFSSSVTYSPLTESGGDQDS